MERNYAEEFLRLKKQSEHEQIDAQLKTNNKKYFRKFPELDLLEVIFSVKINPYLKFEILTPKSSCSSHNETRINPQNLKLFLNFFKGWKY